MALMPGCTFGQRIMQALGIDVKRHPVRRLVIDIPADGAVLAYFERFVLVDEAHQIEKLAATFAEEKGIELHEVKGLSVDDKGRPKFREFL